MLERYTVCTRAMLLRTTLLRLGEGWVLTRGGQGQERAGRGGGGQCVRHRQAGRAAAHHTSPPQLLHAAPLTDLTDARTLWRITVKESS